MPPLRALRLPLLWAVVATLAVAAGCDASTEEDANSGEFGNTSGSGDGGANAKDDGGSASNGDGSLIDYTPGEGPDTGPPPPPPAAPNVYALKGNFVSRAETGAGTIDANASTYLYAPKIIYDGGLFHFWACWGVSGDYIGYKSSPTLAGLAGAPLTAAMTPSGNEVHTCDPSVVRGDNGLWYLHYTHAVGARVGVSPNPGGPFIKSADILARPAGASPDQYGRGQTSVTRGGDGNYYMAFTNLIAPVEPNSVVILRSADPGFGSYTEVTRFDSSVIDKGAYTTDLTYDPVTHHFLFTEGRPDGYTSEWISAFDDNFKFVDQMRLPINVATGLPSEGQSLLTDAMGRVLTEAPGVHNSLLIASSTWGGPRSNFPTHVTGPSVWKTYPAFRNLAQSFDFEGPSNGGFAPWPGSNVTTYTNAAIAFQGSSFLATNAGTTPSGGGAFRDTAWPIFAGSSYRAVMYVRAQDAAGATGTACVWMLGGSAQENNCANYTVTNAGWKMIDLPVNPVGDHDTFRVQIFAGAGTTFVDGVSLSSSIFSTGFERDGAGFVPVAGSNVTTYRTSAAEGESLLATNSGTAASGGGAYRDIESVAMAGVPHTLSLYVRAQDATGATGQACVWALGISKNETACVPYTATQSAWQFLSVPITPTTEHSTYRIQIYTGAGTTFVDAVSLR